MLKKIVCLALGITGLSQAAQAADMRMPMKAAPPPIVTIYNWTGFYIGVNGGYGGDRMDYDFTLLGVPGNASLTSGGGFGGGQIGYNFQAGAWVFGIEADIQASDINGDVSVGIGPLAASAGSKIDYFGTVRGRLGYAWDRILLYATGGYAYAHVDSSFAVTAAPLLVAAGSADTSHNGWVVGAGLEYAMTQNWTFKTEYQYLEWESKSLFGAGALNVEPTAHTVRGGVNYKF
jgi:outer membrane immunogenic protein